MPNVVEPQTAHRPSASHTTQRTAPSEARSNPPQFAHAAGDPQPRQTCATPYPGVGAYTNPRRTSRSACTTRGALPSAPGRTTSTFGHRRAVGRTSGSPSAAVSADGQRAASATTGAAGSTAARSNATSRAWV
jgi:hypothetical protein